MLSIIHIKKEKRGGGGRKKDKMLLNGKSMVPKLI